MPYLIDVGDANAVHFYDLAAGVSGDAPPAPGVALPAGVVAPPAALWRFISTLPGVVNKSGTALTLSYFANNETVHNASAEISKRQQFLLVSAATAALTRLVPFPSPVSFLQLDRMDGVPQQLRKFYEL